MFATIDKEDVTPQQQEPVTPNQLIQQIQSDPYIQRDMAALNQSQMVNWEMANEILAILRDIEGPMYDSAGGDRYLNWETEPIGYDALRRAGETEPARLIKNKRRLDLALFGKSPQREGDRGASLVFRNPDYQPTKEEKLKLREWEQTLFDKLFYPANEQFPSFTKFLGNAYEDFFDLDDITIEYRMDGFGRPIALHLQDPIIYKPVIKERKFEHNQVYKDNITDLLEDYQKLFKEEEIYKFENESPDYLLVYQNQRYAGVTKDRVRKFHFFTRSQFRKAQRGYSVVEQGIRLITNIFNALTMGASNFNNNRLPQGFFAFTGGAVGQMQLEKLKKIFYAYQNGPANANRFPMITLPGEKSDAKWIGVRANSRDMEYHQFMTLLFSILCQFSGTDPRELSLGSYADAVGKKSLFEDSKDGLIKESKDQGARVFLTHLAESVNTPNKYGQNIFQTITKMDVKLQFVGFEVEDRKMKAELVTKDLQSTKSVNDLLTEQDEEKQELMLGDVNIYDIKGFENQQIYQAVLFNAQQKAQKEAAAQQAAMMGQGAPGQPGAQQGEDQGQPQPQDQNQEGGLNEEDQELMSRYKQQKKSALNEELENELNNEEDQQE